MARYRYLVFSNPIKGRENEYLDWYDTVHIPEILRLEGYRSAQRFKRAEAQYAHVIEPPAQNLVIYDIESDDLAATLERSMKNRESIQMSDAIDLTSVVSFIMTAETDLIRFDDQAKSG